MAVRDVIMAAAGANAATYKVTGATYNSGGVYTSTPNVTITGGGGSGAAGYANLGAGIYNSGPYTPPDPQPIAGAFVTPAFVSTYPRYYTDSSFSDASITYVTDGGPVPSLSWSGGGGGTGFSAVINWVNVAEPLYKYLTSNTAGGSGYTSTPTATWEGSPLFVVVSGGQVTYVGWGNDAFNRQAFGSQNLPSGPITITGGGGSGAAAYMTVSVYQTTYYKYVSGISMVSGGSGYTSNISLTNNRGWNTYTTFNGSAGGYYSAYYTYPVDSVTITSQGTGYKTAPSINFDTTYGSGASFTAVLTRE